MALPTLSDINIVKQKTRGESRHPSVHEALRALWKHMEQLRNPDLYIEFFSGLETADQVISDSACKLYFIFAKKPDGTSAAAWLKVSNHASAAAAAGDLVFPFGATDEDEHVVLCNPRGTPMSTGVTVGSHTTVNGNTKSAAADAVVGFVIIGAP